MNKPAIAMSTFGTNGRFGNQLFQYAFLKIYAKEHDLHVQIPRWDVGDDLFGHIEPELAQVLPEIREESYDVANSPILTASSPVKNVDIWGYFQYHTSYYARYKDYFCNLFEPRAELKSQLQKACSGLRSKNRTIVGLHIRLNDYGFSYFFLTPFQWYRDWLNDIWANLDNPVLYIATDRPDRVIPFFADYHPISSKDLNVELPNAEFYPDFYVLTQCDAVAISNSTFSFAACMLNQRGIRFVRPHLPTQRLIAFDPWDSEPILRDAKIGQMEPGDSHTMRQQICDRWLSLSNIERVKMTYLGGVGSDHKNLLKLGIPDEPLTEQSQTLVSELSGKIARGLDSSNLQYFLAAMLYRRSYQCSAIAQWNSVPEWLLTDYIKFLFNPPRYFTEVGEFQHYYQYIQQLIGYLHGQILSTGDRPTPYPLPGGDRETYWQQVATIVAHVHYRIPLYFQNENLRALASQQSDIIEYAVKKTGYPVDYGFRDRPTHSSKIRLGILQNTFAHHSETLTNLSMFEELDRDRFDVTLYAIEVQGDSLERYCQNQVNRWVHLPEELKAAVKTIRSDELDILLIGSNVTGPYKKIELLALHRLARIQVINSLSLLTSGMRQIDYYIAGNLTAPLPTAQQYYTEELVNLPGSGFCFKYPLTLPEPVVQPTRHHWGANEETIVFISGANFYKIIPELRHTWAKIIQTVPNSLLVLYPFGPNWTQKYPMRSFMKQMQRVFSQYDLESNRLFLCDRLPTQADVNACLKLADIYLDAYPYTGALSLLAPLQVGLPVVVREGKTLRSRRGAAILQEMGHPELISHSERSYIQLAVDLAKDKIRRQHLKQQLPHQFLQVPPFLDSGSYATEMAQLLERLYLESCSQGSGNA